MEVSPPMLAVKMYVTFVSFYNNGFNTYQKEYGILVVQVNLKCF